MGDRRRHIFLVGFSGSGKTTVGRELARALQRPFVDTDKVIASQSKLSIPDLFARRGEKYFRALEHQTIRATARPGRKAKVIALGGGAFESRISREIVAETGVSIWLSCAVREIYRRLQEKNDRPLLHVRPRRGQTRRQAALNRIATLLEKRLPNYRRADLRVATTNRDIAEVVNRIIELLDKRYASY
jgi:shikimate kinase